MHIRNIRGCLLEYKDISGAEKWIEKAAKEMSFDDFTKLLWEIHIFVKSECNDNQFAKDIAHS